MTPSVSVISAVAFCSGMLVLQASFPSCAVAADDPSDPTASAEALAARDRFVALIAELESRDDIYGTGASEAYLGHGDALHALQRDEEALQSYGKALQALRVSNGLYDTRQLPILQQQALAQEALEQWDELDATRHLIYYLTMKKLPAGSRQRFDALLELARWKFRAGQQRLLSGNSDPHSASSELYRQEIRAIEPLEAYQGKHIQLGLLYLELAAVEYQQARYKYALPLTAFQTTNQQRTLSRVECQMARLPDGRMMQICNNIEVPNMEFYMAPTMKKNQDVSQHMTNMKNAVMKAYAVLQQDTDYPEDREDLLAEVQKLTSAYNAFNTADIK